MSIFKKLTKSERQHLKKDAGIIGKEGLMRTIEHHDRQRAMQHGDDCFIEPCFKCRSIAHKLGLCAMQDSHVRSFVERN